MRGGTIDLPGKVTQVYIYINIIGMHGEVFKPSFSVNIASVTKQFGSSNCGLFAIAYYYNTHCKQS